MAGVLTDSWLACEQVQRVKGHGDEETGAAIVVKTKS